MPPEPTETRTLQTHLVIRAPRQTVYRAFTDLELLWRWFSTDAEGDPSVLMTAAIAGHGVLVRATRRLAGRHLTWRIQEASGGPCTEVTVELARALPSAGNVTLGPSDTDMCLTQRHHSGPLWNPRFWALFWGTRLASLRKHLESLPEPAVPTPTEALA